MGRTGTFLAGQRYGVEPDVIVMAKELSGGLVPCAAVLIRVQVAPPHQTVRQLGQRLRQPEQKRADRFNPGF